jgi:hypothetical protein
MSKNRKRGGGGRGRQRHISVRGIRRTQPDLRKLSRALIALAMAQAAAEAAAEAQAKGRPLSADAAPEEGHADASS